LVLAVPALLGAFWGAPLVARELESRTSLLAWTQSVTRLRWFLVKIAVTGAATVITAGLLSLMVTWWASPHDRLTNAPYSVFDQRDIVPVAYALFAVALGVVLGTIVRRTLPAMAATLVAFVVIRIGFGSWIRSRILSPFHSTGAFTLPGPNSVFVVPRGVGPRDWIFSETVATSTGRVVGSYDLGANGQIVGLSNASQGAGSLNGAIKCANSFPTPGQSPTAHIQAVAQRCVDSFHLHTIVTYLPSSRYWALQWDEAVIFVGGAVALIVVGLWWIRKHIA
jgi:ABC-type transport system involved in multi-copper enzyme maturation permease subunit